MRRYIWGQYRNKESGVPKSVFALNLDIGGERASRGWRTVWVLAKTAKQMLVNKRRQG